MHLVEIIAQKHLKHRKYPKQNDLKAFLFILYIQFLNNRKKTLKLTGDIWIKSYFCPMVMNDFNSIYTVNFLIQFICIFNILLVFSWDVFNFTEINLVYRGSQ